MPTTLIDVIFVFGIALVSLVRFFVIIKIERLLDLVLKSDLQVTLVKSSRILTSGYSSNSFK